MFWGPQLVGPHLTVKNGNLMPGTLNFDDLKTHVSDGSVDTVLVCIVDMQGRLMGKRFHAQAFVESGHAETHCCTYLLATDL